ncbi:MAG: efflux RND transporter periplasmic adaptor subunit [Phycisphaerae bacterium]|nr:efflux RND transporter periplasmic adaptor subunit [Phycisphaerae bacterium]
MARKGLLSRLVSIVIGAVLIVVAVVAVFFFKWKETPPAEPPVVRPLKTMLIGELMEPVGRKYPGEIIANDKVKLAFQVDGKLIKLDFLKGQQVPKGYVLGRIDPRDFEYKLQAKRAVFEKKKADKKRYKEAFKAKVATAKELDDAIAAYELAAAEEKIAAKALDDTYLRAPFAGIIADKYVDNFQDVRAKQDILSLQAIDIVKAEVDVSEGRIATYKQIKDRVKFRATFDFLPGRAFDVELKEYTTDADPITQTYRVTFVMPAPKDVNILPGMTVTINERLIAQKDTKGAGYLVPVAAAPVDDLGQYYVQVVKPDKGDTHTVHRMNVKVGEMEEDKIFILEGVTRGQRIATAGVRSLREGQRVTLFKPKGAAKLR